MDLVGNPMASRTDCGEIADDYNTFYSEYFATQKEFMETANRFLEKSKLPPMDLVQADASGWNTVQSRMEQACSAIEKVSTQEKELSGMRGKMVKAFRGLCRNAATGKLFTSLIPDDMGGSVLCGGLNVICTALEQTSVHREAVYKALERLPRILNNHVEFLELVGQDADIHQRAAKLYTEVLRTLNHILRWYTTNAFVVGAKRLINPSALSANLNDHITEVQLAAKDLKSRATFVLWKKSSNNAEEVLALGANIGRQFECVNLNIQQLHTASYDIIENLIHNNVKSLLGDYMQSLAIKHTSNSLLPAASHPITTSAEFLRELEYDPNLIIKDVNELRRLYFTNTVSRPDANRLWAFKENRRVTAWRTVHEDSLMLVNARSGDSMDWSTTMVNATFIRCLIEEKPDFTRINTIPLGFFCSQHRDPYRDEEAKPERIALNLVLQLVHHFPNFEPTDLRKCLDKLERDNIDSIFRIFRYLVKKLPETARVYLILDGLSFTRENQERSVWEIVDHLICILLEKKHKATLKFMFCSPTRANFLEKLFDDSEILNLPLAPMSLPGNSLLRLR
ncbi:hypothetical protein PFICI_10347 [Pestalotiopsis fici W106-1]|uniref:Fungal STAND N-terminal Goodbye domain-containing protein n=1 Tax=Pestalotiopsis fici (strain W106-1 / CGMCC3.15140) TaxID=1229662 RepID=W3WWR2_PESFW|nr:uncharacterized protein PFICI_10347 [Pestalotiopsis fici W106-1]ETS78285.1 hypothetical protein PFICI_10347 [Pestalotiopsis fici W106-1]